MKRFFNITKIGNSLFATLSRRLVNQLNIKPGDKVSYEIVPGKKKIIMNLIPKPGSRSPQELLKELNQADRKWIEETAGSLTVK
jgi:antitoxin component of MazEF toxin-antitoxin module